MQRTGGRMPRRKLKLGTARVREVRQDEPGRVTVVLDMAWDPSIEIDAVDAVHWPVTKPLDVWATASRE